MKTKIAALIMSVFSFAVQAAPYVEYKNEYEMKDFNYDKKVDHLRFGYQADSTWGKPYFEIGPMTHGTSWEAGYKFKLDALPRLEFKGKLETKDTGVAKSKFETEIRYTF